MRSLPVQITLNAGFVPNCARISAMHCAAGVSARVAKGVAAHMVATRKPNAGERRGAVGVFSRRDGEPSKRLLPKGLDPAGGRIAFGMKFENTIWAPRNLKPVSIRAASLATGVP